MGLRMRDQDYNEPKLRPDKGSKPIPETYLASSGHPTDISEKNETCIKIISDSPLISNIPALLNPKPSRKDQKLQENVIRGKHSRRCCG